MSDFILTYSEARTYKSCPKKHDFMYRERLVPLVQPIALREGSLIHEGLHAHYRGRMLPTQVISPLAAKQVEKMRDQAIWDDDWDKINKSIELCEKVIEGWIEYVSEFDDFDVIDLEREFKVRIPTPQDHPSWAWFAGKIDGLVMRNGKYWLMEHKAPKSVGASYIKQLQLDEQVTSYIWAIQKDMNIEIVGCIYNILRRQMPGPRVKTPLFYREYVYRNQNEIDEIAHRLYWTYRNITARHRYAIPAPSLPSCRGCPYWSLCVEDTPEARMNFRVKDKEHEELEEVA